MISLTEYTSADEVRAVIGVDAIELPDATVYLPVFSQVLHIRLAGFSGTVGTTTGSATSIFDALSVQETLTDGEEIFILTVKQLATYIVAEACCSGLSMFALKSDSDGKATQSRFSSEATFKDVVKNIQQRLASLAGALDSTLGNATEYAVGGLSAIQPITDVVTNE